MARTLTFHAKHALGVEGAKNAISQRYAKLCASPLIEFVSSTDMSWEGDTAHVQAKALGAKGTAKVAVTAQTVTITIHLPLVLAPFAGMIETLVNSNEDAIKPPPAV